MRSIAEKFKQITRREGYEKVLAGIRAAQQIGFHPLKVNAVSVRGLTEDEIVPFGHFARETGVEMRFIEYMPLDADCAWQRDKVLFAHEIIETLSRDIMPLVPCGRPNPAPRRREFVFADGVGRIGFIASVSQPFCMDCNRFRLTADGQLRNCLFSLDETDIRGSCAEAGPTRQSPHAVRAIDRRQEGRARNQHGPLHSAVAADVLDRRMTDEL